MKTIKQFIRGTPSIALQMMLDGLLKQSRRRNFRIAMTTFGNQDIIHDKLICLGCAATCTIQQITNHNFTPEEIYSTGKRAKALGFDEYDLEVFERAMNDARQGDLVSLFSYCGKMSYLRPLFQNRFILHTQDWKNQVPNISELIHILKAKGL